MKTQFLTLASAMVLALGVSHANAQQGDAKEMGNPNIQAYSKTTEMKVVEKPMPNDLLAYDLNGNGILEANEVGERLFYQFDRDGNEIIDNLEFYKPLNLTFAPVERTRVVSIDYNNNGVIDSQDVESEVVMKRTGLDRFAAQAGDDGITPRDFIGKGFIALDLDQSGTIELNEWKKAYMQDRAPLAANNEIYNN